METDIQIHKAQRIPNRLNLNRAHQDTLWLNCQKSKTKNGKAERGKRSYVSEPP